MKADLERLISEATESGHRGRILARGLARGLIWKNGIVPDEGPQFPEDLSENLIEYGYSLFSVCLQYKKRFGMNDLCKKGLLWAGEAIESVVRKGAEDEQRGFNIISAAMAYHLAGYSARAYCMVNEPPRALNLSKVENLLLLFLKRDFSNFRAELENGINDSTKQDVALEKQLQSEVPIDEHETLAVALENNLLRAISWFEYAMKTGSKDAVEKSVNLINHGLEIATEVNNVSLTWHYRMTSAVLLEVWDRTFHEVLPTSIVDVEWENKKRLFISSMYNRETSEVDLWPSQIEAAKRSHDSTDDLVVTMPTSSGKTRIAELCILRCLSEYKRVVYVTPLRALSAQTEKTLIKTFGPLGYSVSNLYGSTGATSIDVDTLLNRSIVVSTPEKLDFAIRSSPEILDDVGLIVLDEGHMIGLGEREIRYEILIQRLLRRSDAYARRVVCLSAILPEGEQLNSLVAWLRQDVEGEPVQSMWKPNRHRIGVIQWMGTHAKLDFKQTQEQPFVPRFLESKAPIRPRRTSFPRNKNEMVLASAWKLANDQHRVLIYCPERRSVEPMARLALQLSSGHLPSLLENSESINSAIDIGNEWLGADHIAVQCLKLGIAVHHGQLPRAFQAAVEDLIDKKICKVVISSPTLAQGLNISASALLINSIHRNRELIPQSEFANVIGRSGRAFVDLDGLVLFPIFVEEDDPRNTILNRSLRSWDQFVRSVSDRDITSGLLLLVQAIAALIAKKVGTDSSELLEYVLNSQTLWNSPISVINSEQEPNPESLEDAWEKYLAFLDTAILSLTDDLACDVNSLANQLDLVLEGSLWQRHMEKVSVDSQEVYRALLSNRAEYIWKSTTTQERRSYYAAGIGLSTGKGIYSNYELKELLIAAEEDAQSDVSKCLESLTAIAAHVFQFREFKPYKMCDNWQTVLNGWITGKKMSELIQIGGDHTVQFITDALSYKLVWAIEAIRVAEFDTDDKVELENEDNNILATALECGSLNRSVCLLIQSGLTSRLAAHEAVILGEANFDRREYMWGWLFSKRIREYSQVESWPSKETSAEWKKFYNFAGKEIYRKIGERKWIVDCKWQSDFPIETISQFRIQQDGKSAQILTPDYRPLGIITDWTPVPVEGNLWASRIDTENDKILVTYLGPDAVEDLSPTNMQDWF